MINDNIFIEVFFQSLVEIALPYTWLNFLENSEK